MGYDYRGQDQLSAPRLHSFGTAVNAGLMALKASATYFLCLTKSSNCLVSGNIPYPTIYSTFMNQGQGSL